MRAALRNEQLGEISELIAAREFLERGYRVFSNGSGTRCAVDFFIYQPSKGLSFRVQVKHSNGRGGIGIAHKHKKNGVTKNVPYTRNDFDILVVVTAVEESVLILDWGKLCGRSKTGPLRLRNKERIKAAQWKG